MYSTKRAPEVVVIDFGVSPMGLVKETVLSIGVQTDSDSTIREDLSPNSLCTIKGSYKQLESSDNEAGESHDEVINRILAYKARGNDSFLIHVETAVQQDFVTPHCQYNEVTDTVSI